MKYAYDYNYLLNFDEELTTIPSYYIDLIKQCLSKEPSERSTFDEIVEVFRKDPNLTNDKDYQNYIKYIDNSQITFESTKNIHKIEFLFPKLTGFHLSPEVYTNKEYYSKSSDVYTFSLIAYEIITNNKPFKNINTINQIYELHLQINK